MMCYCLEKSTNCELVAPWGRLWKISKEMVDASKTKAEGGSDIARQFWDWTKAQVEPYY
jgi:retinol dehydrogenase-12